MLKPTITRLEPVWGPADSYERATAEADVGGHDLAFDAHIRLMRIADPRMASRAQPRGMDSRAAHHVAAKGADAHARQDAAATGGGRHHQAVEQA